MHAVGRKRQAGLSGSRKWSNNPLNPNGNQPIDSHCVLPRFDPLSAVCSPNVTWQAWSLCYPAKPLIARRRQDMILRRLSSLVLSCHYFFSVGCGSATPQRCVATTTPFPCENCDTTGGGLQRTGFRVVGGVAVLFFRARQPWLSERDRAVAASTRQHKYPRLPAGLSRLRFRQNTILNWCARPY